jgi:hypothetical protein
MNHLLVVLGDAVASRDEADRAAMERKLHATCKQVNAAFGEDLRAGFRPIKGVDEFGGVLHAPRRLHRIVAALVGGLSPVAYRIVATTGAVDAGLGASDVTLMDGPAFHDAARRMDRLKTGRLLFDVSLGDPSVDALLTGYLNLLAFRLLDLSERQWEVVRAVARNGTQEEAAAALGVTQQAVSKALARARWAEMEALQNRVDGVLGTAGTSANNSAPEKKGPQA